MVEGLRVHDSGLPSIPTHLLIWDNLLVLAASFVLLLVLVKYGVPQLPRGIDKVIVTNKEGQGGALDTKGLSRGGVFNKYEGITTTRPRVSLRVRITTNILYKSHPTLIISQNHRRGYAKLHYNSTTRQHVSATHFL